MFLQGPKTVIRWLHNATLYLEIKNVCRKLTTAGRYEWVKNS